MDAIVHSYNYTTVLLSFIIIIFSSYVSLDFVGRIENAPVKEKKYWLIGGSLAMGLGIWSMHFTGMLALHSNLTINYDAFKTLLSLLAVIGTSLCAYLSVIISSQKKIYLIFSGMIMGLGIIAMHYIGLSAVITNAALYHNEKMVLISVFIAIAAAFVSLFLFDYYKKNANCQFSMVKLPSAVVMGFAVTGMHYTAMHRMTYAIKGSELPQQAGISPNLFSFLIFIASISFLTVFIYVGNRDKKEMLHSARVETERYKSLFNNNPHGILLFNEKGNFLAANKPGSVLMNDYGELKEQTISSLAPLNQKGKILDYFLKAVNGEVHEFLVSLHTDQKEHQYFAKMFPMTQDESIKGVYWLLKDITDYKTAELQIQKSEEQYRLIAENSSDLIQVWDINGIIHYLSPSYKLLFGEEPHLKVGSHWLDNVYEEDQEMVRKRYEQTMETKEILVIEYRQKHKQGNWIWVESKISPVYNDEQGTLLQVIADTRDMTEKKRYQEALERKSIYDTLTGLPNWNLFEKQLGERLLMVKENDKKLGLLAIDFDNFKIINDMLGHEMGDIVLKKFVERLKQVVRTGDVIGRLGGDKFGVILPSVQSESQISIVAERILDLFREPFLVNEKELTITGSIGISLYPKDGEAGHTLLKHANRALDYAKQHGRNYCQFFTAEIGAELNELLFLDQELKKALHKNEFYLKYQPQICLATERVVGMEALLRWRHSQYGEIPPGKFIPIAEKNGTISEITEWVLKKACLQNKAWIEQGLSEVKMSVNISGILFYTDDLEYMVTEALNETALGAEHLQLEITESAVIENMDITVKALKRLKNIGVEAALDDFGTGVSSLSSLKTLPISILKIDKSFVDSVPKRKKDTDILKGIIKLAHTLDLQVVVEGTETAEQIDFLKKQGCNMAQGYYYSKPLTEREFEAYMREKIGASYLS